MAKKKRPAKKARRSAHAKKRRRRRAARRSAAAPSLDALARKIVRLTQMPDFGDAELRALYTRGLHLAGGGGQTSLAARRARGEAKRWAQMQSGTTWKATNVWVGPKTICIEWDATVNTRDGRTVNLPEVAVHEIKGGKIQSERFYYNPIVLAPPHARRGRPVPGGAGSGPID